MPLTGSPGWVGKKKGTIFYKTAQKQNKQTKNIVTISRGRTSGHDNMDVGEDSHAQLEVLVFSGDVGSSRNVHHGLGHWYDVDIH